MPLRIAAKVPRAERGYFKEQVEPLVDGQQIQIVGEVNERSKENFLANASALLFPIDRPEPFGLVMIEAMACGTPVIAFRRGSVPEVVEHGATGFIVDDEDIASDQAPPGIGSQACSGRVRATVYRAAHGGRLSSALRPARKLISRFFSD
jgi:glycosyltransferase involved in cell wall biosynthesis